MSRDVRDGIALSQRAGESRKLLVLRIGEGLVVGALQFHSNGEVVTTVAAAPVGLARVPSAPVGGHKLNNLAGLPNEKMGRNP